MNGFDAFTTLASATATSQAGKGLHLATLAWAGRHMSNMGQVKYEAMSERLGEQATGIVLGLIRDIPPAKRRGEEKGLCETEAMTLLGGLLMLVQFKVCFLICEADVGVSRRCLGLYSVSRASQGSGCAVVWTGKGRLAFPLRFPSVQLVSLVSFLLPRSASRTDQFMRLVWHTDY